jgi:DNA-binding NarL/FixJ family response regulator
MRQTEQSIRVLLVDDHTLYRNGLRAVLERYRKLHISEASSGHDALRLIMAAPIDVVVLDMDLGPENGLDLIPALRRAAKHIRVIALTSTQDDEYLHNTFYSGASGLVTKDQTPEQLILAIEKVYAGEAWLDRSMISNLLSSMSRVRFEREIEADPEEIRIASLTERERGVIALIGEGLSNRHIAERLSISETTVRHHLSSIFDKLGTSSRLELVIYAYRNGLVSIPSKKLRLSTSQKQLVHA